MRTDIDELIDLLDEYARSSNIHVVCVTCGCACKMPYTLWFGDMPETEYCDTYTEHPFWRAVFEQDIVEVLDGE